MIKENKKIKVLFYLLVLILIFLGIFYRTYFYSLERPFWNDEVLSALNVLTPGVLKLFGPLGHFQFQPPLFLLISKASLLLPLSNENALRLFPFLTSILSLFVFYLLADKTFTTKGAKIISTTLFSLNYTLIYFSQEFKPYGVDAFLSILILYSYFLLDFKNAKIKKLITFGLIYSTCLWVSFTSVFTIFSVILLITFKNRHKLKKLLIFMAPLLISGILFLLAYHNIDSSGQLHNDWANGFINKDFSNFIGVIKAELNYIFDNAIITLICTGLFLAGFIYSLYHTKKDSHKLLSITLIMAFIFSYLCLYPLYRRVSVWIIPIVILITSIPFDIIKNKFFKYSAFAIFFTTLLFLSLANLYHKINLKNYFSEEMPALLSVAKNAIKDEDILYVSSGSNTLYDYYNFKNKYGFKNVINNEERVYNENDYIKKLNSLEKNKRYYYIYAHFVKRQERIETVWGWAKKQKEPKLYIDQNQNALVVFTKK